MWGCQRIYAALTIPAIDCDIIAEVAKPDAIGFGSLEAARGSVQLAGAQPLERIRRAAPNDMLAKPIGRIWDRSSNALVRRHFASLSTFGRESEDAISAMR